MTILDDKQAMARRQAQARADAQARQQRTASMGGPGSISEESLITDGFVIPDLDVPSEAPPAYGDQVDRVTFTQPGFQAGAAVTGDGRVNINISTKNRRLAELLAPVVDRQVSVVESQQPLPPAYIPPSLGGLPGQTPPPALNIVIQIVGSRGDVQPFVALGKTLRDTYGHRVRIATHATFQKFVEENDLEFFSIGGDPAELMAFMVKNPGLMPGFDALKSGEVSKRRRGIEEILMGCWRSCIEPGNGLGPPPKPHARSAPTNYSAYEVPGNPADRPFVADAIIANPPSFAHIHIAEKMGIPLHMMFTMPWTPTRSFQHPLANIQSSNLDDTLTNNLTYTLVEIMTWQGLGDVINRFREKALELPELSPLWAPGLLTRLRISYTYCWSPALIPKPNDWGNNIDVSGFYFLDLASSYTPDPELDAFLNAGSPPVYIGFGSIVVDDPNAMTRMIFDAIHLAGVRALVSKGWGGLGAEDVGLPEGVYMLGNVPHDWLFQHVSAVVHHGGAGTTAAGIKAGKPTFVVPFFGDQPFWGSMIARSGAGPDPVPYKDLTAEKLAEAIKMCIEPGTMEQAKVLGQKIREEKGTDEGGYSFHKHLDVDKLRCSLVPSRVAAWRVRRTKVRLSPLAASVLVDHNVIKYTDLKLYRPCEFNTDDQPTDPLTAGAAALMLSIGTIGMAIADMPRELWKTHKKYKKDSDSASRPTESSSHLSQSDHRPSTSRDVNVSQTSLLTPYRPSTSTDAYDSQTSLLAVNRPSTSTDANSQTSLLAPDRPFTSTDANASQTSLLAGSRPSTSTEANAPQLPLLAAHLPFTSADVNVSQSSLSTTNRPSTSTDAHASQYSLPTAHTPDTPLATGALTPTGQRESPEATPPSQANLREEHLSPGVSFGIDSAVGTARGVNRIIEAGVKSPMNFCLGLAKGFRNMPRLYNDDLVRPVEKVTDLSSGIKVAGKELGYGFFDGISGLVRQPLHGAEKEGAVGLVKGFGKGIGGLILKPAAGIFGLPGYAMQGVHAEFGKHMSRSVYNYIISSRIKQGEMDFLHSSDGECEDILRRWNTVKFDLSSFYDLKRRRGATEGPFPPPPPLPTDDSSDTVSIMDKGFSKPRTGWFQTRHLSSVQRKRMQEEKQTWKRGYVESLVPGAPLSTATSADKINWVQEIDEVERAIQASVRETSKGVVEDDAEIEAAIRESLRVMRESGALPATGWIDEKNRRNDDSSIFEDEEFKITDEEYQDLIQSAMRQSLVEEYGYSAEELGLESSLPSFTGTPLSQPVLTEEPAPMDDLYGADEASSYQRELPGHEPASDSQQHAVELPARDIEEEEEYQLQLAIAESKQEMERKETERNEEDIVLEYIKKQSLAEEEFRKRSKGKGVSTDAENEEEDEELRRAMEESLKMSHSGGGQGSGSGSGSGSGRGSGSGFRGSSAAGPF
ncbi:Glycosyl transferase, family 28 [Beauveria bassiana ARSEF 2860]|uniref:Glycosyl transferase, family 28 n=1 Tax=Beauveria bassiana (strain ARSEF 2860) TaxID=655819 RepID=J4WIA9_BEAB2|nr:Glycosyl transferase, family 28 [Beauveria bassiana ARSEF 2860]EJP69585.1 Glycosyl transferase, family 28 [Beauveria bassiana ARSEF 2860]